MKHQNRLQQETSPYLLQHAHNPVDWYPWGEEALEKAKREDKPILVSIGYATCHWCHVMERESFENEEVAAYMNEHFVNIKIDREERPDLDAIYMDAVQLIQNGQGGWPLNCFLLPDSRPFFGGTYFPPRPAYQRASWMQVLQNLQQAFSTRREEVEQQANKLLHYMKRSQEHFVSNLEVATEATFTSKDMDQIFDQLQQSFDAENGGLGGAPKFPGTMALRFCLNYYQATQQSAALEHLQLSLDKMSMGGIYDHLGGGFSRYTVDEAWLVPHFEKMLYDNALLVGLLADAYKLTKSPLYKARIEESLAWVEREMSAEDHGFYSALDADSEGVEGKFYVWEKAEVEQILGEDSDWFCAYYDVTEHGNWEEVSILNCSYKVADFVAAFPQYFDHQEAFETALEQAKAKLFAARVKRIRPLLDDKQLLDWNALMVSAYCKAYQALGKPAYKARAIAVMQHLMRSFRVSEDSLALYHTYKNGQGKQQAFLDDYAFMIAAFLDLYEITQQSSYLNHVEAYAEWVKAEFFDVKDQLYCFTAAQQQDVLFHRKSIYDSAIPSGNATMIHNLLHLATLTGNASYQEQVERTLTIMKESILQYPTSFGRWANALFLLVYPIKTVSIAGSTATTIFQAFWKEALWNTYIRSEKGLLSNVDSGDTLQIVVCEDQVCQLPVSSPAAALELLQIKAPSTS